MAILRRKKKPDALQGTLDLLVLKTLSRGLQHGYGIATHIADVSDDALRVEEGSLYPALYRLESKGLIKGEWRTTENNRDAKYYRLTAAGARLLAAETSDWRRFADAMDLVLLAEG
jgi:transcriptional regulator